MNVTENRAHPVAPEEVMAFLDGEVSAERAALLVTHVNECGECKQVADALRYVSLAITQWTPPPAQHLAERVLDASAARARSKGSVRDGLRLLPDLLSQKWFRATLLASAVVLIAFGVSYRAGLPVHAPSVEMKPRGLAQITPAPAATPGGEGVHVDYATVNKLEPLARGMTGGMQEPMIARSAELTIVVGDFEGARGKMEAILTRHRGYAANLSTSNEPGSPRGLMALLRFPAAELNAALAELKGLGLVRHESQKGEEVTAQHADLVARLNNARETEKRMQAILEQRTGKISDVLAVEQEIARVRGEIEQMEAEQKTLEHRVDFAAVELKLAEEYKAQLDGATPSISRRLRNALVTGYKDAVESLVLLCLFVAGYGPILLLWVAILFWPTRFVWRRWRRAAAAV